MLWMRWPFASVDSTDIGQNHHRPQNTPALMAKRWDSAQCAPRWTVTNGQMNRMGLFDGL